MPEEQLELDLDDACVAHLLKQRQETLEKINQLHTRALNYLIQAQSVCKHEETSVKSNYFPGGYLDTDYTDYTEVCSVCGIKVSEWRESGNSYG